MPRYFFDTDDGDHYECDDEGLVLEDAAAARRAALGALPDMARDRLPNGDRRTFIVSVRDETGGVIYSVTLDLVGAWHVTQPTSQSA